MFGLDAVVDIDVSKLDMALVNRLRGVKDMVKDLDDWVLAPDKSLLPKLKKYADILKRMNPLPNNVKLFRGFDPSSSYQDTMGLSEKGWFKNKIRHFSIGEKFLFNSVNPISFSTSESIAKAFGDTVVTMDKIEGDYIWLSDELSYLISLHRQVEPQSQKEVIVLPPALMQLEVIRK